MKKLGIFALLLSLGMFSFGCGEPEKKPTPPTNPPAGTGAEEKPKENTPAEDKPTDNTVENGEGS